MDVAKRSNHSGIILWKKSSLRNAQKTKVEDLISAQRPAGNPPHPSPSPRLPKKTTENAPIHPQKDKKNATKTPR